MLNHPVVNKFDLSSIYSISVGAAPMDESVTTAFHEKFPRIILMQGYGLTESLITHIQPCDRKVHKPGSAGFVVENVDWKICCLATGKSLGPNEKGEVCTRGPQVMKGYLNNPEATANCLTDDGWLHSGDLGYYDEDGNIFVVDRLKELIKYKGLQVYFLTNFFVSFLFGRPTSRATRSFPYRSLLPEWRGGRHSFPLWFHNMIPVIMSVPICQPHEDGRLG